MGYTAIALPRVSTILVVFTTKHVVLGSPFSFPRISSPFCLFSFAFLGSLCFPFPRQKRSHFLLGSDFSSLDRWRIQWPRQHGLQPPLCQGGLHLRAMPSCQRPLAPAPRKAMGFFLSRSRWLVFPMGTQFDLLGSWYFNWICFPGSEGNERLGVVNHTRLEVDSPPFAYEYLLFPLVGLNRIRFCLILFPASTKWKFW